VEFRILGPLEVVDEGRPVSIRRGKELALLTYLLLHPNEVVPRERLIDELWDERPPATAPKILHNAVSHLRKQLGNGRLVTREPGYLLRVADDELDLKRFERLAHEGRYEDALGLWRGSPLLDLRDARFADDARRRLEDLRLGVLEDRIEADLAAGRHGELVPELEELIAAHPLRERLYAALMLALYRAGRQADALETYQRARKVLSRQLGLDPSPQLQTLERKILRQDPELAAPAHARPRAAVAAGRIEETAHTEAHDERRPVTVLFADIVGSTALGERLAPDEVKALVGECVTLMSQAVEEYGGVVQAYQGDGICAYFGVPAAHADDPERAARAGLRILELGTDYARDIEAAWGETNFAIRVGINTGQAGVGLVGAAQPGTVALGDVTNVAARLQATAAPGTIAVGDLTARRLSSNFKLESLGDVESRDTTRRSRCPVSSERERASLLHARRRSPDARANSPSCRKLFGSSSPAAVESSSSRARPESARRDSFPSFERSPGTALPGFKGTASPTEGRPHGRSSRCCWRG
jgi:DNA-binding SARP family transcriptional activator